MTAPSPIDEAQLLREARSKAERLMVHLIAQRDDLERFAPQIDPDKRALGQQAFANAIDSIRKTLDGIDQTLRRTTLQAE